MRQYKFYSIILFLLAFYLTGCKEETFNTEYFSPSLSPHFLTVSQDIFYVPEGGENYNLEVKSSESWNFQGYPQWIDMSPSSGNGSHEIEMKVLTNSYGAVRSSIFYLQANKDNWNLERSIFVEQNANTSLYINFDSNYYTVGGAAGTLNIPVYSNFDWEVTSSQNWLTAQKNVEGDELTVMVEENPFSYYRQAILSFSYQSKVAASITIEQFPAEITVSDAILNFENHASKYNVTINSESAWNAVTSADWIMVTPSNGGAGEVQVSIEVTPNESIEERKGFVAISTGSEERLQIEIIQKGLYLETENLLSFSSRAESKRVSISSNIDWEISDFPEWLSIAPLKGSGNSEISVTSLINESTQSRSGAILLTSPGLSISFSISVIQSGKSLSVNTSIIQFDDKGGSKEFSLIADGSWTSSVSDSWIKATPMTGSGDAKIKVTVDENTSESERSGSITYKFGEKEITVTILQKSKYFEIDSQGFTFTSEGGSHIIDFASNQSWTAQIEGNPSWLSVNPSNGDGGSRINIVASPNKTVNDRSAVIIITPQYSQAIRINVLQKGMYMTVSVSSLQFFAKGGESSIINVETDGIFNISQDVNWLSIDHISDKSFKVIATENQASEPRKGNVTLSLQGLSEGSYSITIPVEQAAQGGSFIIEGYPSDGNWNNSSSGNLSITVNGYESDQNWNSDNKSSLTITINGFSNDQNWNNAK